MEPLQEKKVIAFWILGGMALTMASYLLGHSPTFMSQLVALGLIMAAGLLWTGVSVGLYRKK